MKTFFVRAMLSFSMVVTSFLSINLFQENVSAFNCSINVIVEDTNDYDLDYLKTLDNSYRNINIELITIDDFSDFIFDEKDLLVVENELLLNTNVNSLVKERLEVGFVYFIGQSNIDSISSLLGETLTIKQAIFELESDNAETKIVPMTNNTCSVLRYSKNPEYKEDIETNYIEGTPSAEEYLIPCCNYYIEQNSIQPYALFARKSGSTSNWYLVDKITGKTQTNYVKSIYKTCQKMNDSDSSKDYFVLVTENYFSKNGAWMQVTHKSDDQNAGFLSAYPTNCYGSTSWSNSYKSISGAKVRIGLTREDTSNRWTFSDATLLNNANFDSGDNFYSMTEISVPQGKKPSFIYSIYALDKAAGKTEGSYLINMR